jgi:hypothetical protein
VRLTLYFSLVLLAPIGCERSQTAADVPRAQAEPPGAPREQIENPLYTNWAGFKPGTIVVYRAITAQAEHKTTTTTTTTYTLLERTEELVVVEMQAFTKRYDGLEIANPPEKLTSLRRISLPPGVQASEFSKAAGVLERGEETVEANGRAYSAIWQKSKDRNEAGEVLVTTWTSDEVPGKLVRSVTHTPAIGKTTTTELIAAKTP